MMKPLLPCAGLLLLSAYLPALCAAQVNASSTTSLSGSVSDPSFSPSLVTSDQGSGLDSSFEGGASNLVNPSIRADVNDPTHSQLLGSALSPFDYASVNAAPQTAPQTAVVSDPQAAAGLGAFGFGGHRNLNFAPAALAHTLPSAAARQQADSFGALAAEASFAGGAGANAAFGGRASRTPASAAAFSGEGAAAPATTLPAILAPSAFPLPAVQQSALPEGNAAGTAASAPLVLTDPVLTNSSAGYDTGPEIHGDLPSAVLGVAGFFADYHTPHPVFQYDDGQTPAPGIPEAGGVLGGAPFYTYAKSGFPDSTRGSAALYDPLPAISPFGGVVESGASPFPPVSEGSVFEPGTRLNPDLHHVQILRTNSTFEAYERRLRRMRLSHGVSISQADQAYQQDLKDLHRNHGRVERKPALTQPSQTPAGLQLEMNKAQSIR